MLHTAKPELARIALTLLALGGLLSGTLWILWPFLGPLLWSTTIVVATWPLLLRLERRLRGSRRLAVAAMTALLLFIVVLPLAVTILVLVEEAPRISRAVRSLFEAGLPSPPEFVRSLPGIGVELAAAWERTAAGGPEGLGARLAPYADDAARWLLAQIGHVGYLAIQFLVTVILAMLMYLHGERLAAGALRFGRRLAEERGETACLIAAGAIRAVALGVGVTALLQASVGGLGLLIAGVPFAPFLCALMFLLCIAQLGPTLVLAPVTLWAFFELGAGWGIVLLVWTIIAGTMDNIVRPLLIRRGADLPLLLILAGVIGGLLGFGLIGLFVGPVVLAVSYRLLVGWVAEAPTPKPRA